MPLAGASLQLLEDDFAGPDMAQPLTMSGAEGRMATVMSAGCLQWHVPARCLGV